MPSSLLSLTLFNNNNRYWLFNMFYTQFSIFAVLSLRTTTAEEEEKFAIRPSDLWVITTVLACLWLLSIGGLMLFSEKNFRYLAEAWQGAKRTRR